MTDIFHTDFSALETVPRKHGLDTPASRPLSPYDAAVKALHHADRRLALSRREFLEAQESVALAMAPFEPGIFVNANAGCYEGRSFRAEKFSIGYDDAACTVPVLSVTGPLDSGRAEREVRQGQWRLPLPGLLQGAKSREAFRPISGLHIAPVLYERIHDCFRLHESVRAATEARIQCHRDVLLTREVVEYVRPVKPGEEGEELSAGGWREFFGLKVKLERVQLKSVPTKKPWNPADLSWIAQGRLLTRHGRDLGVPVKWVGNVSTLRAGGARQAWQRVRDSVPASPSDSAAAIAPAQ
jgi:hypothetical protein